MSSGSKLQSPAEAVNSNQPANLAELNQRYSELCSVLALPDIRTEAWHYGRPDRFVPDDLSAALGTALSTRGADLLSLLQSLDNALVLRLGPAGLEFLHGAATEFKGEFSLIDKSTAFRSEPGLAGWLAELAGRDGDRLEAEHLSQLKQVLLVAVPAGVDASATAVHLIVDMPANGAYACEQIVLDLASGSAAELHLHLTGDDAEQQSLLHLAISLQLADDATLKLLRYQNTGQGCDIRSFECQQLGSRAHCHSTSLFIGGRHLRHDVLAALNGPGCESILRGLYLMGGRQTASIFSHQDHRVPNAHSDLLFKGTMLDRAAASYLGQITVAPHAQGTDAYQSNRCLLLSPKARSMSSPQLEIEANDVRCSHGASVTNVSAEELFYLESRGIDPDSGRQLLIGGFVAEISDLVPEGALRDYVSSHMLARRF